MLLKIQHLPEGSAIDDEDPSYWLGSYMEQAFEELKRQAYFRGKKVTGYEIQGEMMKRKLVFRLTLTFHDESQPKMKGTA